MSQTRLLLVRRYYLACALTPLEAVLAPVVVLYYVDFLDKSFATYTAFLSLILVMNLVLEVPLGMLSDRIGRAAALLVGNAVSIAALAATLFVSASWQLFAIAVALSFGQSLTSGNLQSIAFEVFSRAGVRDQFGRFLARNASITILASAAAALVGGFLADLSLALPMLADIALAAVRLGIGIVVFVLLWGAASGAERSSAVPLRPDRLGALAQIVDVVAVVRLPSFWAAACAGAICFAVLRASLNFYQPFLASRDWSGSEIGILFSVAIVASALLSRLLVQDGKEVTAQSTVCVLIAALVVSGLCFALADVAIGFFLVAFALHQMTRITVPSFATGAEQASMPEGYPHRTTAASLSMALRSVVAVVAISVSGQLAAHMDHALTLAALNIVGALLCGAVLLMFWRSQRPKGAKS